MLSYTTILVLALAVSNVSPVLSAPIPQVQEQSLSRRGPNTRAPLAKRKFALGGLLKKVAIIFGMSAASTAVGYAALDGLTGPSKSTTPAASAQPPPANSGPPPANSGQPPANSSPPPPANSTPPPPANSGPPPTPTSSIPATNPNPDNSNTGTDPDSSSSTGGSIFGRSVLNEKRSATSASELFSRTDLDLALKLFKRILDELD